MVLSGQGTAVHDPAKASGAIVVAVMVPLYPALHVQLLGTSIPKLLGGHWTALAAPLKNGAPTMGVIPPLKPALVAQPVAILGPLVLAGQGTFSHVPSKKSGPMVVAEMVPLKPALQVQPEGT